MKFRILVGLVLVASLALVGCSSAGPDVVGMWQDASGGTRVFSADGTCQNVAPIDIGGSAPTFTVADKADSSGRYAIRVAQGGMNEWTYYIEAVSRDRLKFYENPSSTEALYDLTRQ